MSGFKDEDDRRRRLEAGREMLEKYKAGRSTKAKELAHTDEMSDEESFRNDKSIDPRESCVHEGMSSRDITQSSVSMSEGEADGDLEGLMGRVAELQQELHGKEAIVEALNAEIDHLHVEDSSPNSSQSQASSMQGKDVIYVYHSKLQEFEKALTQRDNLIEDLTNSLQQALSMRDGLVAQLSALNSMDIGSPRQQATMQEKIDALEKRVSDQKSVIEKQNAQMAQLHENVQTLKMEKETRNAEINDYKLQINNLNEQIRLGTPEQNLNISETLEQQKQYETRIQKIKQDMEHILEKFTIETNTNAARHQKELNEQIAKHEVEILNIKMKYEGQLRYLKEENKTLTDRLKKELPDLETRHAKELSVFQSQLVLCKKTVENLKHELVLSSEGQKSAQAEANRYKEKLEEIRMTMDRVRRAQELNHEKEKEMLSEQIKLHKIQLEEMTSKCAAMSAILESKESIERSLEHALMNATSLKDENKALQFKLDDLSSRYSAAQSLIENNQLHERSLNNRIFDLEKSLSRLSGVNMSMLSELNETTYQKLDDAAVQYHVTKHKLEEKEQIEKQLMEKINGLEKDVQRTKEELEESNRTKKSYEKQLKDMKNTCDKYQSELNVLRESNAQNNNQVPEARDKDLHEDMLIKIEKDQEELVNLRAVLKEKDTEITNYTKMIQELTEKMRRSESECSQLKNGLSIAWAQCAEVEQKLNQSLGLSDSKLDMSLSTSNYGSALIKQLLQEFPNDSTCDFEETKTDALHSKLVLLSEENERLAKDLKNIQKKHEDQYEDQKMLIAENQRIKDENVSLRSKLEGAKHLQHSINSLRKEINSLRKEKDFLRQDIKRLVTNYSNQIKSTRLEVESQCIKMETLLLRVQDDGAAKLSNLKTELEAKHTQITEELRTYFEHKCREIEKQYSEEVFSQQSKKMSDNDSEIEQLSENLFFAGAGDCLNVSNLSACVSRAETPLESFASKTNNLENDNKFIMDVQNQVAPIQQDLQQNILRMENLRLSYDRSLDDENIYEKEVQDREERDLRNLVNQHSQTEWGNALEEGDLSQLQAVYHHQLEEKIAQERFNIITALQEQIQALLTVDSDGEDNWPPELLELRDKFTSNAKSEIEQLKEVHAAELLRLKEENARNTTRMIDRHREEMEKIKANLNVAYQSERNRDSGSNDLVTERNNLHKMCGTLKSLIEELIKYFIVCEEEVNGTLITEVLKRQLSNSISNIQKSEENNESKTEDSKTQNSSQIRIKRVHFAPRSHEIVSILKSDVSMLQELSLEEEEDITEKLKQELDECLRRLKLESAEILGVSLSGTVEDQLNILSREIMAVSKLNEELSLKLSHAENLIMDYEEETEQLKLNILELQRKLTNIENKKEIISEGYGVNDGAGDVVLVDFSQLQEKARLVLSNGGGDNTYLLQLIEDFCRQSDKLVDDAKKEREDLQQQIDAADKQLRSTRKFLDEQASEREAERDEAAKQINLLQEQLKERERERERDIRLMSESALSSEQSSGIPVLQRTESNATVETLESQMKEMSSMMSNIELKKSETEDELKAAVNKIWMLREIIADLEQQLKQKTEKEESLTIQITQLKTVISAQTKNQQDLVQELDNIKMGTENRQLNEHINQLQEELQKHKLSSEQFNVNSAALKQMKVELRDMQGQLDRRTKELESTHMCGSTLSISQPSEDVSIREQIDASRCPTPDDPTSPPMLPLDHLLKLKEKMQKHARAEEVALKRIKDLEMQLNVLKTQNEELQEEQEILQQTASEQLFQIEAMRGRLEQQKQSAPFAQRQATSRLEIQLHEANAKFQSLERTIADKDLELKEVKIQLERVTQLLQEKESEIANVVQLESATIKNLRERLEVIEEEKKILQAKVGAQQHSQMELPQLIDSMLADKNEEIDHLKEQLSKKEKQLDLYSSLALDETQLREMARQAEGKNSARTLSDILSIHSECEEMPEAIRAVPTLTENQIIHNVSSFKVPVKDALENSAGRFADSNKLSIHIPPLDLGSHSHSSSTSSQQQSHPLLGLDLIQSGCESRLTSEDVENSHAISTAGEILERKVESVQKQLRAVESEEVVREFCVKCTQTSSVKEDVEDLEKLQKQLKEAQEEVKQKYALLEKREADLVILQRIHEELQLEFKETVDTLTRDKCFYQEQYELSIASENKIKKDLMEVENTLKLQTLEMQEQKNKTHMNEKIIMELNSDNNRLRGDVEGSKEEVKKHVALLQEKMKELQQLRDSIMEKDITIETIQTRNIEIENENKQLYEYKTKYELCKQDIISRLQELANGTSSSGSSTPSEEKRQEIHHLEECLKEKDKVIRQMSDDCKSLHRALETIQNKMKESGNIVELRKQLKDERKLNEDLRSIIEKLQKELNDLKQPVMQRSQEETDIEDMVQRELNLSAHLDRQILSAIESDVDEGVCKLDKDRNSQDYSLLELKSQLGLVNKYNEELRKMKDELEVKKDLLECQIIEYETRIFQLKADLTEEYKKVAKLDKDLSAERNIVRTLKYQIDRDQRTMLSGHKQDSELIELLRDKLRSSVESESKLRKELSVLRMENKELEMQLSTLKEHVQSQKEEEDNLPRIADVLENEQKKYFSIVEKFENEERISAELRDALKRIEREKNRCEKQLELAIDEKEKLLSSLALVEGVKEHLDSDLRRTKVELKAREEECDWLQKRIKTMTDAETKKQEQRSSEHNELKSLRRELNNAREFMADMEADMKQSKRECTESLEREKKLEAALNLLQNRETELLEKLAAARDQDRKSKEFINDLQQDLKMSTKRQLDLSKDLKSRSDLSETTERYAAERNILREKLLKVSEEREYLARRVKSLENQLKQCSSLQELNLKNPVFMKKLEYFCAHYLRADSMRKALAFQKSILLKIISGHEIFEENTFHMLMRLVSDNRTSGSSGQSRKQSKPKRFKTVALVIISIRRMKWMIKNLRYKKDAHVRALLSDSEPTFLPVRRSAQNHSPPVRERPVTNGVDGGLSGFGLDQYYQRLRNIQETLGLAMADAKSQL